MATNTYINIDMREATLLADLAGIRVDLDCAREFAVLLKDSYGSAEKTQPAISDALSIAFLIKYSRPFARSGGVRMRLDDDALKILTDEERRLHFRLLAIRNKYIAHSVNAFEDSQPVARYWEERVQNEGITSIEVVHTRLVGLGPMETDEVIKLTEKLLEYVWSRYNTEKVRLLEIVRQISLDELFRRFGVHSANIDTKHPEKPRSVLGLGNKDGGAIDPAQRPAGG